MITGTSTQFPNPTNDRILDVVIGIDFGTSCTKVVIRAPYEPGEPAMVVPYGDLAHKSNQYLLPTRLFYDKDGALSLASSEEKGSVDNLKTKLIGDRTAQIPLDLVEKGSYILATEAVVAYIALVLQIARYWFLTSQEDKFGQYTVAWQCNLGVPSQGYDDDEKKKMFKGVACMAWGLSTAAEEINFKLTRYATRRWTEPTRNGHLIEELQDIHVDSIQVLPEVIAEVVGYAKSDGSVKGLHVIVDIGAQTVDVAAFIIPDRNKSAKEYQCLTADLDYLGTYCCHLSRVNLLSEALVTLMPENDLISPAPDSLTRYAHSLAQMIGGVQQLELNEFGDHYKKLMSRIISALYKCRDPNSPAWETGLPIYLCGGGREIDIYGNILRNLDAFWKEKMAIGGINIRTDLPRPSNLEPEEIDGPNYHRFAVAYGLSYPEYDIGEIVPPNMIPDLLRRKEIIDIEQYSLGKEME